MDQQLWLDRIIGTIYDSAADPKARRRLLADIAILLDSHCARMAVIDRATPVLSISHGCRDLPLRFFGEAAVQDQPRRSLREPGRSMTLGIHFGSSDLRHDDLVRARFHADYLRPCRVDYSMAACFLSEGGRLGVLAVHRDRKRGDYGAQEHQLLGTLVPHLARATAFAARLQHAERQRAVEQRAWDLMPWGFLLLAGDGQVVQVNRMAEKILREGDGLAIQRGRLAARSCGDMARLRALLAGAALPPSGSRSGGTMPVARRGRRPLQLWAMPLPGEDPASPLPEPAASICVLVLDPERQVVPPIAGLKALYGLTRAEAELVAGLLRGERLADYCEKIGISLSTARTHLRSVFGKTDTSRQAELMRLVATTPFRLDAEP